MDIGRLSADDPTQCEKGPEHVAAMERARAKRPIAALGFDWSRLQLPRLPFTGLRQATHARLSFKAELLRVYGLTVIPLLALITSLAVILADREQDLMLASLEHRTDVAAQDLDSKFNQQIALLRTLAGSRSLDEGDLAGFYVEAERALQSQPEWLTIVLSEPTSARQVLNLLRPLGSPLPTFPDRASHETVVRTG